MSEPTRSFYITFGQRYRTEPHPSGRRAHPDGYIRVEACCEEQARDKMDAAYGNAWSHIYHAPIPLGYAPLGELDVLS